MLPCESLNDKMLKSKRTLSLHSRIKLKCGKSQANGIIRHEDAIKHEWKNNERLA